MLQKTISLVRDAFPAAFVLVCVLSVFSFLSSFRSDDAPGVRVDAAARQMGMLVSYSVSGRNRQ